MVQMRALLALGGILLATANDTTSCALDGASAVDEMLDSAVYIWASVERCQKVGETLRCEIDVASAIESVNGMINVIVKAVERCGAIKTEHPQCGMAAGGLTKTVAGLAAASGGLIAKCPNALKSHTEDTLPEAMDDAANYGAAKFKHGYGAEVGSAHAGAFGECVIDVKDSLRALFSAIKRMMSVKKECEDPTSKACVTNSLKVVAAFTELGGYLAGAVSHCGPADATADCAGEVLTLVTALHDVGQASAKLADHCSLSKSERLYLEDADVPAMPASSSSVTLALVALLPVTAVLAFVGGSRLAKTSSNQVSAQELE